MSDQSNRPFQTSSSALAKAKVESRLLSDRELDEAAEIYWKKVDQSGDYAVFYLMGTAAATMAFLALSPFPSYHWTSIVLVLLLTSGLLAMPVNWFTAPRRVAKSLGLSKADLKRLKARGKPLPR